MLFTMEYRGKIKYINRNKGARMVIHEKYGAGEIVKENKLD